MSTKRSTRSIGAADRALGLLAIRSLAVVTTATALALATTATALVPVATASTGTVASQEIGQAELADRRARIMDELPNGIVLIHARSAEKAMEQWGFVQDATFQYLTGLRNLPGAILTLDGPRREARLWLPPPQRSFGMEVALGIQPGEAAARTHGFTSVDPWDGFVTWVRSRIGPGVPLYVDGSRRPEASGAPPGMRPVAGERTLWRAAVEDAFPAAEVRSAREVIQRLRWAKSPAETELLAANAVRTARALTAVAGVLKDGITQREAESAVVSTCLKEGGEGPSFWPWTQAGPNAHPERLVGAFFDYEHLNRPMRAGELVRVDIGCAGHGYGADVGRTLPVDGTFTDGQRETWDLLVAAYRAGLDAIRADLPLDDLRRASVDEVARVEADLRTPQGRDAARALLDGGLAVWHIHGVGIESGEEAVDPLVAGAVIAYEPGLQVGADAFYLEDMILVTQTGHRVLSTGLPYTAAEIETLMARGR